MRRTLQLESQHPMTFDGLKAEVFIIAMRNNVLHAYVQNLTPGVLYSFIFVQDNVGGHTFAWPSGFENPTMIDPAPNSVTNVTFIALSFTYLAANLPGTSAPVQGATP